MSNNITRVCPFIRPIALSGGTFYTFQSAAEDLGISFNESSDRKFKFSKFALLNLPDILNAPLQNTIKLNAIPGAYNSVNFDRTTDWNNHFSESFQNYCLNLETAIISKSSYNKSNFKTVSERVFFKWLKEISSVRYQEVNLPGTNKIRYTEENKSNIYNKVVQYIGNIDFVNNLSTQANSYSEIYFNIPTEVGNFQKVYFNSVSDENYFAGMAMCRFNDGLDNEFIYGRHYNDIHPAGLDFHAFYDNAWGLGPLSDNVLNGPQLFKKKVGKTDNDSTLCDGYGSCNIDYDADTWWFYPTSDANCYYTEPITFLDPTNEDFAIVNKAAVNKNLEATKFKRSKLDGIEIDFDETSYINENANINYLIDVARSANSTDFEFNAVLVYYDLYTGSNETPDYFLEDGTLPTFTQYNLLATNLFGVLFLDNVENDLSLGGGHIPRFKKCRPNSVTSLNGNAYGFKLNLKLDVSAVNSGVNVETFISDSNTLSMDIYAGALNEMRKTIEGIQDFSFNNAKFDNRLSSVENYVLNDQYLSLGDIKKKIDVIESTILQEKNITFAKEKSDILSLIQGLSTSINDILSGKVPTKLTIDLNMFKPGEGVNIDTSDGKNVIISTLDTNFNLGNTTTVSIKNDWIATEKLYSYEVPLIHGRNYLRLEEPVSWIPNKNLSLYIVDSTIAWTRGQVFRLYLKQPYQMRNGNGSFDLNIYTGKKLPTWKGIAKVTSFDFESHQNRPIIEIICVDDKELNFIIDFLN